MPVPVTHTVWKPCSRYELHSELQQYVNHIDLIITLMFDV